MVQIVNTQRQNAHNVIFSQIMQICYGRNPPAKIQQDYHVGGRAGPFPMTAHPHTVRAEGGPADGYYEERNINLQSHRLLTGMSGLLTL